MFGINPGETDSDASMRRLQPQIQRDTAQLETKLMNQGIAPGTEAYNRAKVSLGMQQNDLLNQGASDQNLAESPEKQIDANRNTYKTEKRFAKKRRR